VPSFEVRGSAMHGAVGYELNNCTMRRVSVTGGKAFEGHLTTYHVRKTFPQREPPKKKAWLAEWYLNGYHGSALVYPRLVHTEFREEYRKRREFLDEDVAFEGAWWESTRPCAFVETADFGFVLQPIPEELGPSWSKCMSIEYRENLGGIPEPEVREAIAAVVSFVMGRPLVSVGHTVFDAHGHPVEQVTKSPVEDNVVAMCQASEQPPVRLDKHKPTEILEVLLREMVPSYLELKDQLNLDQALWGYWLSEQLPLGANLPELSTSVEIMKKAWFKRTGSKSKGVYMPKRDFDKLLEDEFAAVENKLAGVRYGERILRRIRAAYNMGSNESLEFFLDEINLPVGEVEWGAIWARNPMAHGSSILFDEEAHEQMLRDTFAYRTLFNRILLKILGYEGDYVDRSVSGWPERPLEEPMGGTI
jgi:hypothetical protein